MKCLNIHCSGEKNIYKVKIEQMFCDKERSRCFYLPYKYKQSFKKENT